MSLFFWSCGAAMVIFVAAVTEIAYGLMTRRHSIQMWVNRNLLALSCAIEAIVHDEDDEPHMPARYACWASAKKWRETRL